VSHEASERGCAVLSLLFNWLHFYVRFFEIVSDRQKSAIEQRR